jgi:hypothetical protein
MFWNKRKTEKKYIVMPMLYPMGSATFAVACVHCKNRGTDKCKPCKEERVSGFELK